MKYGQYTLGWKQFGQYGFRQAFGRRALGQGVGVQNLLIAGAWTLSVPIGGASAVENVSAKTLTLTGDGTNRGIADQKVVGFEIGASYEVVFAASVAVLFRVGTTQGSAQVYAAATYNAGTTTIRFTATAVDIWFRFDRMLAGTTVVTNPVLTKLAALRQVANRGAIPNTTIVAGANSLRAETRKLYKLGGTAVSDIVIGFAGFVTSTGNTEVNVGNAQAIEVALEITGAPTPVARVKFRGANAGSIGNSDAIYWSDPVLPSAFGLTDFAANTSFYYREQRQVTLGQFMAAETATANMVGESTQLSDGASASQLLSADVLTTPTSGSAVNRRFGPTVILGRPVSSRDIAVLAIGDSIIAGANDTNYPNGDNGSGGGGFVQRGLFSVNSRTVPFMQMGVSGTQANDFAANGTKRGAYYKYFTHLIENYGTNDHIDSARTAAQVYTDRQTIWSAFKAAALASKRIAALPILVRTSSSDSFQTTGSQTPRSDFEIGGTFKDPMNANLVTALAGGLIDEIIDINTVAKASGAADKWAVDGSANYATIDGTHPSPAMSALLAPVVTIAASAWA